MQLTLCGPVKLSQSFGNAGINGLLLCQYWLIMTLLRLFSLINLNFNNLLVLFGQRPPQLESQNEPLAITSPYGIPYAKKARKPLSNIG